MIPGVALDLLPASGPLVVAVSGGCDSMALWAILARLGRHELTIWHLDHGIRAESARDAELVRACALPGNRVIERADIPELARTWRCGLEEAGRRHRYARLAEIARSVDAPAVVTAHHRDDQAETILLNLLRGSHGLVGIPAQRPLAPGIDVVRPLLGVGKTELRDLLERDGIAWAEDATNADTVFARNRIRHRVLPAFEAGAPGFGAALVAAVRTSESPLRAWLRERGLPASRAIIARLEALPEAGRTTLGGRLIRRTADGWADEPEHPPARAAVVWVPASAADLADPRQAVVLANIAGPLVCRAPIPGERWRPLGAPGHQPVLKTLAARGISARQRTVARVLADDDGPVWVEHCTIAERCRVVPGRAAAECIRVEV